MVPEAILVVRGGSENGRSIRLSTNVTMIGRAYGNDVVVDLQAVSRQHASIRGADDGYWITDMGSRNGTFVNGQKLDAQPRRLQNMDSINFGGSQVEYVIIQSSATMASDISAVMNRGT